MFLGGRCLSPTTDAETVARAVRTRRGAPESPTGPLRAGILRLTITILAAIVIAVVAFPPAAQGTASVHTASSTDPAWPRDTRGDGCTSPVWPHGLRSDAPRRLLVIGDSLIRNTRSQLESQGRDLGWLPTVRCWGAKGTDWGLAQVRRARQLGQLPRTVVISLGTNDIWWLGLDLGRGIDAMMTELGPQRRVYWVNLWFGPHGYDRLPPPTAANRLLRAKARQYSNLTIIDFAQAFRRAEASGSDVGWLDGVHLNAAGDRLRVRTILESIGTPRKSSRN